jgi:hypothetical protein
VGCLWGQVPHLHSREKGRRGRWGIAGKKPEEPVSGDQKGSREHASHLIVSIGFQTLISRRPTSAVAMQAEEGAEGPKLEPAMGGGWKREQGRERRCDHSCPFRMPASAIRAGRAVSPLETNQRTISS